MGALDRTVAGFAPAVAAAYAQPVGMVGDQRSLVPPVLSEADQAAMYAQRSLVPPVQRAPPNAVPTPGPSLEARGLPEFPVNQWHGEAPAGPPGPAGRGAEPVVTATLP